MHKFMDLAVFLLGMFIGWAVIKFGGLLDGRK